MSEIFQNKLIRSFRNSKLSGIRHLKRTSLLLTLSCILFFNESKAANETFQPGAFIINMGIVPQTVSNGLKPYGLLYDLIKNQNVPIKWVIGQGKVKDGIDFTYNGIPYKGGTFIVAKEFRTAAVNTIITNWLAKGVVGVTTTTLMTLDVTQTLRTAPYWAMDASNGSIAIKFLVAAEIPATAYYYRTPATLTCCDDLYVMPHADPKWATHSNLFFWNLNCRGGIWAGCHAVSVMEGPACVNPGNAAQNLKFLTTGGMVLNGAHADGTPPFSYSNYSDPVFQMMGIEDAAHNNGSEQIYLPLKVGSTWRPSVNIGCYDPTPPDVPTKSNGPGVITAYGRGMNDVNRGYVMVQSGHDIGGTTPENVSAQREFFNWSFLVSTDKSPTVTYSNIPATMTGLVQYSNLTATPVSPAGLTLFTYQWYCSAGGTFTAPTAAVTKFTPPAVGSITYAVIYCKITDQCGRSVVEPVNVTILPGPTPPTALNDTFSFPNLCTPAPNTINVLTNDYDLNGNMINAITFIGGGNYGTFVNNGNGSVTYYPGQNFIGTDTMRYQVCDNTNPIPLCGQATMIVTTGGAGICPLGQYQRRDSTNATSVFMQNGIANQAQILGWQNEFDGDHDSTAKWSSDNDSIIVQLGTSINAGDTVFIRAGSDNNSCVDWTVMGSLTSGGFVEGVNSMNFQAPAGANKIYTNYNFIVTQATQYVKIRIRNTPCDNKFNVDALKPLYRVCVTARPTANGDGTSTGKNTTKTTNVKTNDIDPQSLPLTATIQTVPVNGTATVNGAGNIVYTPNIGYTGTDQLIYKACNTSCLCDTAILTITVTNDPCPGNKIGSYHSGNGSSNFGWLGTTQTGQILGVQDAVNGSSALAAKIPNTIGNYITVDLGDTITAGNTIVIRMSSDNNSAVTAKVEGGMAGAMGSPSTTTNFNLPAGQNKIYVDYNFVVNDSTRFVKISQIGVTATIDVDALSFGFWLCSDPPNRAPQAVDDTISTYANRAAMKDVVANDNDPDGNALTVTIITQASHGNGVVGGHNITYTPSFGYIGPDTITYQICDNGSPSLCDTAYYIIVNVYPGPPVAINDTVSTPSGSPIVINVQANDTLAVNSYTYTTSLYPALLPPSNGFAALVGSSVQYTPNFGFTGVDSFAYNLCDNGIPVSCDPAIIYVTVTNRSPVANDDTITTSACNSVIINVIGNDTDPENGTKTISSVSVPTNGTAVISNNKIVYTPSSSPVFTGVATFTYIVCDNGVTSKCDTANVSVTVNAVNPPSNPPNAVNNIDSTYMGQSLLVAVLGNDTDPDGDSLKVDTTAVGLQAPTKGTIQYQAGNLIKYIPNPGAFGVDSFQYKVCDIHNAGAGCVNIVSSCSIAKVYLTIYNRKPALNDDSISTIITAAVSNSVATNDYEPDGQPMTFSIISGPVTGTFIMDALGNYTYTPDGMYAGYEYVYYRACDDQAPALCDTAMLTIHITTNNVPPNPLPDTIYVNGLTPAGGDASTNDSDPNNNMDPNSYSVMPGPINGSFTFNTDGTFSYTADTGFVGIDYLFYTVCDTGQPQYCNSSYVAFIVLNLPPVTVNESYSVNEDNALVKNAATGILANGDYDPNGNVLHVDTAVVTNPVHGIVSALSSNGSFTYTPNAGFNGSDKFIVNVCDSTDGLPSLCTHDTIFITVLPVNDPPVIVNDSKTTNEDTPVGGTVITAGDVDPDSTILSANTIPVSGPSHGGIVINANGTYTYTPALNFNGTDVVVISICDAGNPMPANCVNDTLVITVLPINDPPTIVNDTKTTNEDTPVGGTVITAGDVDPDSTILSANTTPVSGPSHGGIVVNANGTYTYTPAAGFNGTDVVVISICDAGTPMPALCVNDTLVITVLPLNDPPTIVNDTKTTNEDTPVGGTVITAGDVDPDSTILSANTIPVSGPSYGGIVINANGTYTYTPALNFNGTDVVVISICDAGNPMPASCVNDTLVITVLPINDPPTIVNDVNTTNEETPVGGTLLTAGDVDPDSTLLSANTTPVSGPSHGGIVVNANGTYTYTPAAGFNGTDVVVISICDAGTPMPALCVNDTLVITVLPLNDPPTIVNDTKTTNEDTPVGGTVITAGDVDPDSTVLSANTTPVSGPSHGGIVINANGTYTYTPAANFNGTDVVVISICDAGTPMPALCVNDTLVITVLPINDPPVTVNEGNSTNEDTPAGGTVITGADFDPDSTLLSANTTPVQNPAHGNIVVNANGTYTYTPDLNFNGTDTVIISICDSGTPGSLCTNDTLIFTVNAVNDPPIIFADTDFTTEASPVSGTVLPGDDFDPDSTSLTVDTIPVKPPSNGTFVIDTLGNYTYTPDSLFNGVDTVIVSICDGGTPLPAICEDDTLIFTVGGVNDPPVTTNDVNTTNEDTPVFGTVITGADADPDSTMLSANTTPVSGPSHGNIIINANGSYTYTPDTNFNGTDVIVISICDSGTPLPALCTNDTLVITVLPINDPPVVSADTGSTSEGTPTSGTVLTGTDFDPDSTSLTVDTIPVKPPTNGTFVIDTLGNYTYTPDSLFNGIDTVIVSLCDGGTPLPGLCVNDTLIFTVGAVNDPPFTVNDVNTTNEDTPVFGTVITGADADPDSTMLSANTTPVSGPSYGNIVINANGTYTYTPNLNFNGTDVIVISICDSGTPLPSLCTNDTLVITVLPVNDPPVVSSDTGTTSEGTPTSGTVLTGTDFDPDSTSLTVDTIPVKPPSNGTFVIDSLGNYTYTPDSLFNGTDTVIVSLCDGGTPLPGLCVDDTLIFTVTSVNDPPFIVNDVDTTNEDITLIGNVITVADADPEGTLLTANTTPVSGPSHGNIVINANGSYSYTPNLNFNGTDTVVISICDSGLPLPALCVNDTLIFTINAVNDPPVITGDTITTQEDAPATGSVINANDIDPDTTTLVADTVPVFGPLNGTFSIDTAGNYTYTPNADFNGTDTIVIVLCDGGTPLPVLCVYDTLIITIQRVNDAPIAFNDSAEVCSGNSVIIYPLPNDFDIDGDTLLISTIVLPAHGTVLSTSKSLTYTPDPFYLGMDSITYTVCDSTASPLCTTGVIYIDVHGIFSTGIFATEVLCYGESTGSVSVTPVGDNPFTYQWTDSSGALVSNLQNVNNLPYGVYTVNITDSLGCSRNDSILVDQPAAPMTMSSTQTDVKCFGDSTGDITLTIGGGSFFYSYAWSNGDVSQSVTQLLAGTYTVVATDSHGCSDSLTTTITQPAAAISISGITSIANCLAGIQGSVDATIAGGTPSYTYSWSNGDLSQDISDLGGTYLLTVTDSNSCVDTMSFTIGDTSVFTASTIDSTTFCAGDSANLNASVSIGTFQWYESGNPIIGANNSSYTATIAGQYNVSVNNSCGNYSSNNITVTIATQPVLSITGVFDICDSSATQLTATGANNYLWTPPVWIDDDTIANPTVSPSLTMNYNVRGYIGSCYSDSQVTITVHPLPNVTLSSSAYHCTNGSQLIATGGINYVWSPLTGLDFANIATPVATPGVTTSYTVVVSDINNCSTTRALILVVDCDSLIIPTGISPDNDGDNDIWQIQGLTKYPGNGVSIFSRWGNLVYKSEPYNNDWDGNCMTKGRLMGESLPEGTYYYILELGEGFPSKAGFVEIRRK